MHVLLAAWLPANRYRPEKVLHGIMPVFTFMSTGILRQDDVFSFNVIEQTLKHVVPAVMAASPEEVFPRIRGIIEVFVDCMAHIPAHRRLPLFADLLATVGPADFLHVFILLLLKRVVVLGSEKDLSVEELQKFCLSLQKRCSLEDQVASMVRMVDLLLAFPLTIDEDCGPDVRTIFDTKLYDAKQLRHYRYVVCRSVTGQLSSVGFLRAVVEAEQAKNNGGQSPLLRSAFIELVRKSVALVGVFRNQSSGAVSDGAGTARYDWFAVAEGIVRGSLFFPPPAPKKEERKEKKHVYPPSTQRAYSPSPLPTRARIPLHTDTGISWRRLPRV